MTATLLNGTTEANNILLEVKNKISSLTIKPHLVAILVGNDPMSEIYVGLKKRRAEEIGMQASILTFSSSITEDFLIEELHKLNNSASVHGILVQLPLPKHIRVNKIIENISPYKDIDGLNPINLGKLFLGDTDSMQPCTPCACMHLIKSTGTTLEGKNAVIIGRSVIVGKPLSIMLLNSNCTVSITHSRTHRLEEMCRNADIIVSATGSARLVKKSFVKNGAIVIDIGVSKIDGKIVGDVDPAVAEVASFLTPNPKGVGPMTVAYLMQNTLKAYNLNQS